jgi:predicted amidohydrolase YtcJ
MRRNLYFFVAVLWLFFNACKPGNENNAAGETTESASATLYYGGDIITMEGDSAQYAEAVVVKDGEILFVGSKDEAMKQAGEGHTMVDLEGKTLIPAFIDGHGHYIQSLSVAGQVNLYPPPNGPGSSPDAIVAAIQDFVKKNNVPKGKLIQAYGYDENMMPKGNQLNRDHLDAAFPDNPVIVGHVSMHGGVLNSKALKVYDINEKTETAPGGVIVRKPGTNEPYGLIMETSYLPVYARLPITPLAGEDEASRAGQMLYAAAGITLAHEGATHLRDLQTMKRASDSGANIIDIVAFPFMTDLEGIIKEFPLDTWGKYYKGLKIGGVKITADGSPQGKTAFFSTPYLTGGPGGEKNWYGEPTMPQAELNALVKKVYEWGVPLLNHTNGDSTIGMFLEAIALARGGDYSKPWNVTTIHTQFVRRDQLEKFPTMKIRPSFYTEHTFYFSDAHRANRGEKQAAYLSPMRDAIDLGLHPTNHTDFYVAPLDQMFMMWTAVNRPTRSGTTLGADQRITPYEALKAQTIWAAEQYDEQNRRGSLKAGKIADLVILDQNPLKGDPMKLKEISVLETIKEGKTIFKK